MKPAHDKRADSGVAATNNIAQVSHCPNLEKCQH